MGRPGVVLLLAAFLAAGCTEPPPQEAGAGPATVLIEGWIVDERHVPVNNASATLEGLAIADVVDDEGYYAVQGPLGADLLLVVTAPGFHPQSRLVTAGSGLHQVVNVSLLRLPAAAPYIFVEEHDGVLRCAVSYVVVEDPANPHEHQGIRCGDYLPEDASPHIWQYPLPLNATGLVLEVAWEKQTDLSTSLVLKIQVEATGEILGFVEGPSMLRLQFSAFTLAELIRVGTPELRLTILPGAGAGSHEHGAVGVFIEQAFTLYATTFYNQPAEPTYSVAND